MIINSQILFGEDFEFIEEGYLVIEKGRIKEVGEGFIEGWINMREYLAIPALINSHIHIGDSFAKEAVLGLKVEDAVGPKGLKWELYKKITEEEIADAIRDSARYMLNSGTSLFADFREYGIEGINLLKSSIKNLKIKSIIFGRGKDLDINLCNGLGLNVHELSQIPNERKKGKLIAIHAGELKGEVSVALKKNPDIIVHGTTANTEELETISKKKISVVVCPRANSVLGVGIPKVKEMLNSRINVALGTDNVMLNSPNLWREMEFLSKLSYLEKNELITPKEILRMVTINAAKTFKLNSGVIEKGKDADLIFIDKNALNLRKNKNLIATIVHRCEPENVRKVMISGNFVVDKDKRKTKII